MELVFHKVRMIWIILAYKARQEKKKEKAKGYLIALQH